MGANDTREQLEAAKAECVRLEARVAELEAEKAAAETEWEYSIAYPDGDRWDTDGADTFELLEEAESEHRFASYLDSDRVVRRRKAGQWVPVPDDREEDR